MVVARGESRSNFRKCWGQRKKFRERGNSERHGGGESTEKKGNNNATKDSPGLSKGRSKLCERSRSNITVMLGGLGRGGVATEKGRGGTPTENTRVEGLRKQLQFYRRWRQGQKKTDRAGPRNAKDISSRSTKKVRERKKGLPAPARSANIELQRHAKPPRQRRCPTKKNQGESASA